MPPLSEAESTMERKQSDGFSIIKFKNPGLPKISEKGYVINGFCPLKFVHSFCGAQLWWKVAAQLGTEFLHPVCP